MNRAGWVEAGARSGRRATTRPSLDLLRLVGLGRFLRWRHARRLLQLILGLVACVLVLDGLLGPRLAPKNLATLLTWVHYRGLLVVSLLAVGNVFCMGCPLLLPRAIARRLRAPTRTFPRALRGKWLATAAFVSVLFAYEAWDLWGDPRWTAGLILMMFGAALAVDVTFRGAPFCKFVCPIGQFNFLTSVLSPFEVKTRKNEVCESCTSKDCIRGRRDEAGVVLQRGCELALFLPHKTGNLDCTFCLDCVHACPHDNVAIASRLPGEELIADPRRSGIGRLSRRADLAVLVVVFTFGALLNAFGMVAPVYTLQARMAQALGVTSEPVILALLFLAALVVAPAVWLGGTGWLALRGSRSRDSLGEHLVRMSWSLLPLGVAVWTSHYLFHFLTGLWTFVPVLQSAAARFGRPWLGAPDWGRGGLVAGIVQPLEMGVLALGLVGSLIVGIRLAQRDFPRSWRMAVGPWMLLYGGLFGAAVWLMSQPMEMRGTFL